MAEELLCVLPKKKVRERTRRRGDLVACVAAALLGWTGLRGGVSASRSAARAEDETKVGEKTKRVLEGAVAGDAKVLAAGVAGEGVVLR